MKAIDPSRAYNILPPGPAVPPLVQMIHWYRGLPRFLESCSRRYGDAFTIRMPVFGTFVVLSAPDDVRAVFVASSECFDNGGPYAFFALTAGPLSIAAATGEAHLRSRRVLGPSLRCEVSGRVDVVREAVHQCIEDCPDSKAVPLRPFMERITFSVVARIVIGLPPGPEMTRLQRDVTRTGHPMVKALSRSVLGTDGRNRQRRRLERYLDGLITARLESSVRGESEDVLDMLLASNDANLARDEHLKWARAEVYNLLIGGTGSTAAALAWGIVAILRRPEVLQRIEAEIATGGNVVDGEGFEYLDATIKEILRIQSIVPLVFRRLASPLEIGGRLYPAGVTLAPSIFLLHRRPTVYPEPDRFCPERFYGKRADPSTWIPFGGGFRRCLGANLALFEIRLVLVTLLEETFIELTTSPSIDALQQKGRMSVVPSGHMKAIIRKRGSESRSSKGGAV